MITFTYIAFGALTLGAVMCLYRIGAGPNHANRAVGIDMLGTILVGFCAMLAIQTGSDFYLNVAIAWVLLSFVGTIALAKFLEGKGFDE